VSAEADESDVGAEDFAVLRIAEHENAGVNGERSAADVNGLRGESEHRAELGGVVEFDAVDGNGDEIGGGFQHGHRRDVRLLVEPFEQASTEKIAMMIEVLGTDQ